MDTAKATVLKWGQLQGKDIFLFRLTNKSGAYIEITNYGATLVSVFVPDNAGKLENVILGYPTLEGYLNDKCYIGSTIGRYANRISNASFRLDGIIYQLNKNDNDNSNHGGNSGFNFKAYDFVVNDKSVSFSLISEDGEGGYPGTINFTTEYFWTDENELCINYKATTTKKTVLNFTNHAYFNLSAGKSDIKNHKLTVSSTQTLESSETYIPTGKIIAKVLDQELLGNKNEATFKKIFKGLNDYYILEKHDVKRPVAVLKEKASGRILEVYTTYPGIQIYTGDFLNSELDGNFHRPHKDFDGICLECQYYPNAPNQSTFPNPLFDIDNSYKEHIKYKFTTSN